MSDELWKRDPIKMMDEADIPEQRPVSIALTAVQEPQKLFQHFSTWQRLQRATAWLQTFVKYLRTRKVLSKGTFVS